jgi:hypothetical protein
MEGKGVKAFAAVLAGVAGLTLVVGRSAGRVVDDAVRDLIGLGDTQVIRVTPPPLPRARPPLARPGLPLPFPVEVHHSDVETALDYAAAQLQARYQAASEPAAEATAEMACQVVYRMVDNRGQAPSAKQWTAIVVDGMQKAAIEVPPLSTPWLFVETTKNTTVDVIYDPSTGGVSVPTANDLLSDLGCSLLGQPRRTL